MYNQKKAYIYTGFVVLIWATVASAFKITLRYVSVLQLLFFSSLFSLAALFFLLCVQKKLNQLRTFSVGEYSYSALLSLLNPFLYYLVLFKAYSLLPAQEAQPLNQTWAIVISLLAILILKQKITLKSIIALLISFLGVVIISTRGNVTGFSFTNLPGALLALGSAWIWAFFWLFNTRDRRDEVIRLFLNFCFGSVYILITLLIMGKLKVPQLHGMIGTAYVGFFEMGITFVLWLKALRLSKTTAQISNMIYLVPFLSLIVIHLAVGETIYPSTIIGLIFIIGGILLQQYKSGQRSA